jgi:DNA invertase Pin-like site-specific DNA recombinase
MAQGKFVSYLRVSTKRQGQSGFGLEAQRRSVADYLNGGRWDLVEEFVEVETGKKSDAERPQLARALAACRIHGGTLVVAKLDRLARNAHFLLSLQAAGVEFIAADMPAANRLTVGIMAMVAEEEAQMISQRTKSALAAAKTRGVTLGKPENLSNAHRRMGAEVAAANRQKRASRRAADLSPIVAEIRASGANSLRQVAAELNRRGIPTTRGRTWTAIQVSRLVGRFAAPEVG